jgi:hypothetical protein
VAGSVCLRPIFLSGAATASPIFRLIDMWRGTLLLDEGDVNAKTEVGALLQKIRLLGYKRGFSIARTEDVRGERDVIPFAPFGPQLSSNRRGSPDPAENSRCIDVTMPIRTQTNVAAQLGPQFWAEALVLRNQLQLWRFKHLTHITIDMNEQIPKVIPRVREVGLSLLATVRAVAGTGSDWERQLVERLQDISKKAEASRSASWEGLVASALVEIWQNLDRNASEVAKGKPHKIEVRQVRTCLLDEGGETNKALAEKLTQRRVNDILRDIFGLDIEKSNSRQYVKPPAEKIVELRTAYHVGPPEPPKPKREPVL